VSDAHEGTSVGTVLLDRRDGAMKTYYPGVTDLARAVKIIARPAFSVEAAYFA